MHIVKQPDIGPPGLVGQCCRTSEPVGPFEWERTASLAAYSPHADVLPIRGMNHEFPDVVTIGAWTPGRLLWSDSPDRPAQIGSMPRDMVIRAIDQKEQLVQVVVCSAASGGVWCESPSRYRSASIAAIQPDPAAVIACR